MTATPELSVVVPVYKCRECLPELHRRLADVVEGLDVDAEFVLVEDRGCDGSWEEICALAASDDRVRGFQLSRNFGQQVAITAGLSKTRGRWVAVMDCDLQDPPEEIPRLYAKAREGYDVVLGRRVRRSDTLARRMLSRWYFKLLSVFTGTRIDGEFGSFSVISRKVVDAFLRFRDRDRQYILVLGWLGFDRAAVEYEQADRFAGKSSYGFRQLFQHAVQGMFFQTTVLLRWIVRLGFVLAFVGAVAAVYLVVRRASGSAYPGWTSLFVLVLIVGGFIILSTGVAGLYVGRVFDEARDRPLFVIDRSVGDVSEAESYEQLGRREGVV